MSGRNCEKEEIKRKKPEVQNAGVKSGGSSVLHFHF
jgi:hypothetical protein